MKNWKKGAIHSHSFWSDGRSLPEAALCVYRDKLGFDFVCLSDHNIFQQESIPAVIDAVSNNIWPPNLTADEIKFAQDLCGSSIEVKSIGIRRFARLKSFDELQKEWEIPEKFTLIPGCEITAGHIDKKSGEYCEIHLNAINLPRTITAAIPEETIEKSFSANIANYQQAANELKSNSFLMVNHPFWRYWDIDPQLVITHPELKFMEICNNGIGVEIETDDPVNSPDKYWDYVLACRISDNAGVIYATASDDAHYYCPEKIDGLLGCNHGWIMVNCPGEMSADNLINAMKNGDFYSSCGVYFKDIEFDPASGTLKVEIAPEENTGYEINFIVTKKGFDRNCRNRKFRQDDRRFCRNIPVIGEDIGITAMSVKGTSAAYTMSDDDLYVRAVAISNTPCSLKTLFYPETQRAWTQPFTGKNCR